MNVLITGANGFLGSNLEKKLSEKRWNVRVFVRNKEKRKFAKDTRIFFGDIREKKSLRNAVRGVDTVINCAAILPHAKLPEKELWDVNVSGVKNVVNVCINEKVNKLVHISTAGIYGSNLNGIVSEKTKPNPEDYYAQTKFEAEKVIQGSSMKLRSVIIRPTIAYGPEDVRPVFLRLFRMINKRLKIYVGDGSNFLHTIYIENLTNAIASAINKRGVGGEDFIVGDKVCPTMKEIMNTISEVEHKECININLPKIPALLAGKISGMEKTVKFISESRKYSVRKAMHLLDAKLDIGLKLGMEKTYKWYKKNNLL
jgi:dihydroflavonol-4-reductase